MAKIDPLSVFQEPAIGGDVVGPEDKPEATAALANAYHSGMAQNKTGTDLKVHVANELAKQGILDSPKTIIQKSQGIVPDIMGVDPKTAQKFYPFSKRGLSAGAGLASGISPVDTEGVGGEGFNPWLLWMQRRGDLSNLEPTPPPKTETEAMGARYEKPIAPPPKSTAAAKPEGPQTQEEAMLGKSESEKAAIRLGALGFSVDKDPTTGETVILDQDPEKMIGGFQKGRSYNIERDMDGTITAITPLRTSAESRVGVPEKKGWTIPPNYDTWTDKHKVMDPEWANNLWKKTASFGYTPEQRQKMADDAAQMAALRRTKEGRMLLPIPGAREIPRSEAEEEIAQGDAIMQDIMRRRPYPQKPADRLPVKETYGEEGMSVKEKARWDKAQKQETEYYKSHPEELHRAVADIVKDVKGGAPAEEAPKPAQQEEPKKKKEEDKS